jgi:hypothetical protein
MGWCAAGSPSPRPSPQQAGERVHSDPYPASAVGARFIAPVPDAAPTARISHPNPRPRPALLRRPRLTPKPVGADLRVCPPLP